MEFWESGRSKSYVVVENKIEFLLEVGVGVGGTMGDVRVTLGRRLFFVGHVFEVSFQPTNNLRPGGLCQ